MTLGIKKLSIWTLGIYTFSIKHSELYFITMVSADMLNAVMQIVVMLNDAAPCQVKIL